MYNFTVLYTCRYIYLFIFFIIINCDMSHVLEINYLILSYLILIISTPHKKLNSIEKNDPPPLAKKFQPLPALAPPPPPSEINNANSNVFEQLHKYQQCKKCKHLPPISPFSFFHFSSKINVCVWGEWVLNPVNPSPHSHYILCHAILSAANLLC